MLEIIMSIENEEDRSFVSSIYKEYAGKMKIIANNILNNEQDAEDCVHDVVVLIIEKLEKFKVETNENYLKSLLELVCRNVARDKYRKKQRRNKNEYSTTVYDDDDYEILDIPDDAYNAEKIVLSEYNYKYLMECVNNLEDKYRDVILLKYRGWDNKDIADLLCISVEAVRQRLHRAKMKIIKMGGNNLYVWYT